MSLEQLERKLEKLKAEYTSTTDDIKRVALSCRILNVQNSLYRLSIR